jgi:DNA-binding NarL/FixJ family response regulator
MVSSCNCNDVIMSHNNNQEFSKPPRRVLIVETDCILEAGIQSLLASRKDLIVRGITQTDVVTLMEAIAAYRPEVIVIDHRLLASHAARLLQDCSLFPELRVIGMSLSDNHLYIFDHKQMLVSQSTDFLSLV